PPVARGDHDEDPGSRRVLDDLLQAVRSAELARRAAPAVVHHVGPLRWIGVLVVQVGRGDEPLEALRVGLGPSDVLVHVVAADPLGAGGDADLIPGAVVTRGGTGRVGAVLLVVARGHGGEAARVGAVPADVR